MKIMQTLITFASPVLLTEEHDYQLICHFAQNVVKLQLYFWLDLDELILVLMEHMEIHLIINEIAVFIHAIHEPVQQHERHEQNLMAVITQAH